MKSVNVLTPGFTSPNGAAFVLPLIKFKNAIDDSGLSLKIMNTKGEDIADCDYLFLDGKYFKAFWQNRGEEALEEISNLSSKTKVIWFDQTDSSGTLSGQVLPYVHRYLKAQLLKDKKLYMTEMYASRIYADYYHKKYGINDKDYYCEPVIEAEDDLQKLGVSWNSGFMNYGDWGPYLLKIREKLPLDSILGFTRPRAKPSEERLIDVTCRMGISYPRQSVSYQRKVMKELLGRYMKTDKLSRSKYLKEMENCKLTVSPFGFGEITLKDFECFLAGSMLLKPDMDHMDTWPNFYQNKKTCLFHSWDMNDVQEKIDWALNHYDERVAIARNAQDFYVEHTTHKEAGRLFADHLKEIIGD